MKHRLFTLAGALALFAIIGSFYAKPLLAQVRAALVKNVDERARNPYMVDVYCDASPSYCTATYPVVPSGMRLVVEHLNFLASADPSTGFSNASIQQADPQAPTVAVYVAGTKVTTSATAVQYVGNEPVLVYFEAGQTPLVRLFGATFNGVPVSGRTTLSGYLVNLNQ